MRDVPTCSGARDGSCLTHGAEDRDRADLQRRDHQQRRALLRGVPVRQRHRRRRHPVLGVHRAAGARLGRGRRDLQGAALDAGAEQRPGASRSAWTSIRRWPSCYATDAHLHRVGDELHDAAERARTCRACAAAARKILVYHGVSDPIFSVRRHRSLVRGHRPHSGGRGGRLRAPVPRAGHGPLLAAGPPPTRPTSSHRW